MKKLFLKYLAAALLVFSISSCEDHLTQVNPNEITTDSFWKTLQDCETGLIAVYNQFRNPGLLQVADNGKRADLAWPGWGRPNTSNEYYLHTYTDGSGAPNNMWENAYKGIFRANQVIAGLNGIENTMDTEEKQEKWDQLMGEARFFRGLFYFYLHSSFNEGSVLLFDYVPATEEEFYQSLKPEEEIREFFIKDLEYAFEKLPWRMTPLTAEGNLVDPQMGGRTNRAAAAYALGTSYLYQEDYTTAASYFSAIIGSGEYDRLSGVGQVGTTNGELNPGSILEIIYDATYKTTEDIWSSKGTVNTYNQEISPVGGWRGTLPSLWINMAFREDSIDINDPRNIVTYFEEDPVTGEPVEMTRYRDFSLRTSNSIALVDDRDMPYYQVVAAEGARYNNKETGYYRKLTNWDITTSEDDILDRSGINYRLMRMADVYLMYAECLIQGGQGGDVDEALKYVNRVRQRSALQLLGATPAPEFPTADYDKVSYDATSLMNHLMYKERPLELVLEGFCIRNLDLRRWGVTKQRFQTLAEERYHGGDYQFVDSKGDNVTRWGSVLTRGEHPSNANHTLIDYTQAAQNYNEDVHAWWPIPNSETTANPNL